MSLKKRDIKLYVVCHTAKAYFPDRQSCSTLCRQPSGCARSVEVVAVYPSLDSYSVVVFFGGHHLLSKMSFTLNAKKSVQIYIFLQIFWKKLFAQKSYSVFVDYSVLILSSIYKGMGEHFLQPFLRIFQCPPLCMEWEGVFFRVAINIM